ncbi:MAG: 2-dehydropantoate 2-reductase [Cellvibrionaceae bacterium]|jgi:2-dehydropantoate 2-reductase
MNILIFGAGAVGSYLAAYLAQAGHETILVTRSGADRINENGLTVLQPKRGSGSRIDVQPEAFFSYRQAVNHSAANGITIDYVLLTMKSYDVESAVNEIVAFSAEPPKIITMQNGIDAEASVVAQFGVNAVTAGSLTTPVSFDGSLSIIEERADRGVAFSSPNGSRDFQKVAGMFKAAGLNTVGVRSYESLKWSKALINMVGNATSAIVNRHPGKLYAYDPIYQIELRMLKEALAVMKAKKIRVINLPGSSSKRLSRALRWVPDLMLQSLLTRQVSKGRGDKMPSFQIDLAGGKQKSEVIYHNGAVAEHGRKVGVATPINWALNRILLDIATGKTSWDQFNGRPKELALEVNRRIKAARSR